VGVVDVPLHRVGTTGLADVDRRRVVHRRAEQPEGVGVADVTAPVAVGVGLVRVRHGRAVVVRVEDPVAVGVRGRLPGPQSATPMKPSSLVSWVTSVPSRSIVKICTDPARSLWNTNRVPSGE
jgi:hypothetical protein